MSTNQVNCQNCEEPYEEGFKFCPNCGQKTNDELTIGVLFYNTISNYFSFDARFLKSFFPLMFKPGYLAKEFIKGKRLLYLHPAQMYLFISVVFFFIFSFTVRDQTETLNNELKKTLSTDLVEEEIDSIALKRKDSIERMTIRNALEKNQFLTGMSDKDIDSITSMQNLPKKNNISFGFDEKKIDSLIESGAEDAVIYKSMGMEEDDNWLMKKLYPQLLKFYKNRDGGNVLRAFYDTIPIALFVLLPIFALLLKLFFYKRGRYSHHLVFGFYFFSFLFTLLSIVFGINRFIDIPDWIDWLIVMSTFIYFLVAVHKFYQRHWLISFIKSSIISFMFFITVVVSAVLLLVISFWFY
ncbi:DUF3667 domain-containing protein [Winogradskyella sp. R77965]|uniref:DUF3667 domain-containing protein n=1 Tax=Winogradskyella sp. R77965 TaxID=3093872 RepID=UPI0037DC1A85